MGIFDRVVVGVDGTEFGFEALRQTLALASPATDVVAVTALDTSIATHAGFNMSRVSAQLDDEAEKACAAAALMMTDRRNGRATIARGDAKTVLRIACAEHDATLLALGGRGSSRFLGIMAGETATTLLHDAAQSILLARRQGGGARWEPARIVVGVDGSGFSLAALAVADDLAARLGSAVRVESATDGMRARQRGQLDGACGHVGPGPSGCGASRPVPSRRSDRRRLEGTARRAGARERQRACRPPSGVFRSAGARVCVWLPRVGPVGELHVWPLDNGGSKMGECKTAHDCPINDDDRHRDTAGAG